MTLPPLTRRQRDIVDFLGQYVTEHGLSPTLEEIAVHFGVNKVTIFGHVAELERKGVVRRAAKGVSRSLQLVEGEYLPTPSGDADELPSERSDARADARPAGFGEGEGGRRGPLSVAVLGTIAAGSPIETIEEPEAMDFGDLLPEGREVYALRVEGDSMINDAIRTGDVVLVERRQTARDGETVVAVLPDGSATLKRFYREKNGVRLQPANDSMEPILLDRRQAAELELRGVVIGVVRKYA